MSSTCTGYLCGIKWLFQPCRAVPGLFEREELLLFQVNAERADSSSLPELQH